MKAIYRLKLARLAAFFLAAVIVFLLASKITLAESGQYTFLEPLPGFGTQPEGRGDLFVRYAKQIFTLLLQASAILGVLAITYGGIEYITSGGSDTKKGAAKKRIEDGLQGFLLIVGAWLILYTINPRIVNFSLCIPKIGRGANYSVCGSGAAVLPATPAPSTEPGIVPGVTIGRPSTASGNEGAVRQELAAAGITIVESKPGATQVGGLQRKTIDGIIRMKRECGSSCVVTISGGSESTGGHAGPSSENRFMAHGNGYKVDVLPSAGYTSYFNGLKNNGTIRFIKTTNDGPLYRGTYNGGELQIIHEDIGKANEHYDILFN